MGKTKTKDKAKAKAKKVDDELEVLEEVVDEPTREEVDTEGMLSAKQAASAIGTDARTLRKYLRSQSGRIGQGNRWHIHPDDIDQLKADFEGAKGKTKPKRDDDKPSPKPKAKSKGKKTSKEVQADDEVYDLSDELPEVGDEDEFDFSDLEDLDD